MKREIKTKAFDKDGKPITAVIGQAQASGSENKEKKTLKGDNTK